MNHSSFGDDNIDFSVSNTSARKYGSNNWSLARYSLLRFVLPSTINPLLSFYISDSWLDTFVYSSNNTKDSKSDLSDLS